MPPKITSKKSTKKTHGKSQKIQKKPSKKQQEAQTRENARKEAQIARKLHHVPLMQQTTSQQLIVQHRALIHQKLEREALLSHTTASQKKRRDVAQGQLDDTLAAIEALKEVLTQRHVNVEEVLESDDKIRERMRVAQQKEGTMLRVDDANERDYYENQDRYLYEEGEEEVEVHREQGVSVDVPTIEGIPLPPLDAPRRSTPDPPTIPIPPTVLKAQQVQLRELLKRKSETELEIERAKRRRVEVDMALHTGRAMPRIVQPEQELDADDEDFGPAPPPMPTPSRHRLTHEEDSDEEFGPSLPPR